MKNTSDRRANATEGIDIGRLEEICNAERDGRCVVLFKPVDSLTAEYSDGTEGYIPLKSMRICEQGCGSEKGHGIKGSAGVSGCASFCAEAAEAALTKPARIWCEEYQRYTDELKDVEIGELDCCLDCEKCNAATKE